MLKLQLQYFGHMMRRVESLERALILGKTEGKKRKEQQRIRQLDIISDSIDMNLSKRGASRGQRSLACYSPWGQKELDKTQQLKNNNNNNNTPFGEETASRFIQIIGEMQFPSESEGCSVVSDTLRPRGLYSPWNSPGWNTGVGSLSLLQGLFPTQESNPGLPHCRCILYQLSHKGSSRILQ